MRKILLALSVVLASASASAAGIYRWVDANGAVHHGDKVPEAHNNKAKPVNVTAASEVDRAAAQEAFNHCTDVPMPKCQKPPER